MLFKNEETVLITGGTSGIGLETAKIFSAEGARVIICGRNEQKGQDALAMIKTGRFISCDISRKESVAKMFREIENEYGHLDIAVNNAAISKSGKYITEFTTEDFEEIVNINIRGLFYCLQEEISMMQPQGKGAIVNVASVLGLKAHKSKNALYTMTKHAVVGLTREAALEYAAEGIRVNAVLPGYTETEIIRHHLEDPEKRKKIEQIHPINRLIQPNEVAEAILFLCSSKASAMTGALVPVDGGCLAM